MNDDNQPKQSERNTPALGNTTNDVSKDAKEALRRYMEEQEKREQEAAQIQEVSKRVVLRMELGDDDAPMIVTVERDIVIGRRDPTKDSGPDLDLTAHGAYQLGISRKHAILRVQNKRLNVVDLGSRNGTYLNGRQLEPNTLTALKHGDELRLGKINLKLYFESVE